MTDTRDLRHDYWPCENPECEGKMEHCGEIWCGAPRDHSLHTCAPSEPAAEASNE